MALGKIKSKSGSTRKLCCLSKYKIVFNMRGEIGEKVMWQNTAFMSKWKMLYKKDH